MSSIACGVYAVTDQKRVAVGSALHGPITADCPASVLRRHPDCALYLDAESDPDA
jgi:glucosamine-6-phosphate deaminase